LISFNASFNTFSGNYQVSLKFYGYKYNILNEITLASVLAVSHMYESTYTVNKADPNSSTSTPQSLVVEGGTQKINEVYSEYKAKGLLTADFPELTLAQFMNKIDLFETNVLETYPKANVQPLTDCRKYKATLKEYYGKVYQDSNSWFNKWMNPKPLIGKENNQMYYVFKDFTPTEKDNAQGELKKIINDYTQKLDQSGGVLGSMGRTPIVNNINESIIIIQKFNFLANIDEIKSIYKEFEYTCKCNTKFKRTIKHIK
jgi:hypothetical protein